MVTNAGARAACWLLLLGSRDIAGQTSSFQRYANENPNDFTSIVCDCAMETFDVRGDKFLNGFQGDPDMQYPTCVQSCGTSIATANSNSVCCSEADRTHRRVTVPHASKTSSNMLRLLLPVPSGAAPAVRVRSVHLQPEHSAQAAPHRTRASAFPSDAVAVHAGVGPTASNASPHT